MLDARKVDPSKSDERTSQQVGACHILPHLPKSLHLPGFRGSGGEIHGVPEAPAENAST